MILLMTSPEAALRANQDVVFETGKHGAHNHVPVSACKVALNEGFAWRTDTVESAVHTNALFKFKTQNIESFCTENRDIFAREV